MNEKLDSLVIELLRLFEFQSNILVMPKNQLGVVEPLQPTNRVQTAIPSVMIPRKRSMRMSYLIILLYMKLIRSPNKRTVVFQVDL